MNLQPKRDRPKLMTFAPMVDSECARLLLDHHGIAFDERDHMFGWVSVLTLFHGGYGRIPLLYGRRVCITSPRKIAEHYDAALPEERKLIPTEGPLARQVEADWETFNGGIGAHTAVFNYYHLLPERELMTPVFQEPVPRLEAKLTPPLYPVTAWLFRTLLRLSPERAGEALDAIRAIYDDTDRRVADGRMFLCGDRVTLGDMALASASAALLLPPQY
nr:hypothetical protein [Pseudomonadota bacterium]